MAEYAKGTTVPIDASKAEAEKLANRLKADAFIAGTMDGVAFFQFRAEGRFVRLSISLATWQDVAYSPTGRERTEPQIKSAMAAENRRLYRALVNLLKAKVIAIEEGIVTFEQEFFANVVMPDGNTVYDASKASLELAYSTGKSVPLLPPPA